MSTDSQPFDITTTAIIFDPASNAHTRDLSPTFFQDLDSFGDFGGHILVMQFSFDETWSTWEVHPHGDEVVYLLSGATDLILRDGKAERTVRADKPGSYVVIPKGAWYTAHPLEPTSMLFLTPGAGTLNAESPPV